MADPAANHEPIRGTPLEVRVDDRGIDRALRRLRRILATEGILREVKRRRQYEKPSSRKNRKEREAQRRRARKQRGRDVAARAAK